MVFADNISGTVTVQLSNVTLANALNTILKTHGYHYILDDDIILIKPLNFGINNELQNEVFHLRYLDGYKLRETLMPLLSSKGKIAPLLSEKGEKEEEQRANILLATDYRENLAQVTRVIESLDVPDKQIQIEVRLVETVIGSDQRFGIDWPRTVTVSATGAETDAPVSTQQAGNTASSGLLSAWYELPNNVDNLNLGVLTFSELKATLDLLKDDQNSKLISNPKVTTLNNKKAAIEIGTTIPIPEISRGISGDLFSYKEKDVSMTLEVVPQIGEDGMITLKVHPRLEEIIGYTGPDEAPQPITSIREVTTTVMVQDGQTVAIGGLVKNSETKNEKKIWLLGDIPVLGYLFTHTSVIQEKKDLLIFITTKIMSPKS